MICRSRSTYEGCDLALLVTSSIGDHSCLQNLNCLPMICPNTIIHQESVDKDKDFPVTLQILKRVEVCDCTGLDIKFILDNSMD